MINHLICSNCGGTVSTTAKRCDHCIAELNRIRCAACDFIGDEDAFPVDRCPMCGCSRLLAIARAVSPPE